MSEQNHLMSDVLEQQALYLRKATIKHRTSYRKALLECQKFCTAERKRVMKEATVGAKTKPATDGDALPLAKPKLVRQTGADPEPKKKMPLTRKQLLEAEAREPSKTKAQEQE